MRRGSWRAISPPARTVLAGLSLGLVTLALSGCGLAGSGHSSSAKTLATTATTVASTATPAANLAKTACQQFRAAVVDRDASAGYAEDFTADAEAEQAARLSPGWASISSALDTVKSQISTIDGLQGSSQSNSNATGTLNQALGTLRGDLTAVSTLCAASGL